MTFEQVLGQLNKKGVLLSGLSQIEDGKLWSANVRKKGTTKQGYGRGKTIEKAVRQALGAMRDPFDPKGYKDAERNPKEPEKRKRVRIRKK
jgi:hypothetical protein